eukprot:1161727-Pelagomonas_calceolata.AAC.4
MCEYEFIGCIPEPCCQPISLLGHNGLPRLPGARAGAALEAPHCKWHSVILLSLLEQGRCKPKHVALSTACAQINNTQPEIAGVALFSRSPVERHSHRSVACNTRRARPEGVLRYSPAASGIHQVQARGCFTQHIGCIAYLLPTAGVALLSCCFWCTASAGQRAWAQRRRSIRVLGAGRTCVPSARREEKQHCVPVGAKMMPKRYKAAVCATGRGRKGDVWHVCVGQVGHLMWCAQCKEERKAAVRTRGRGCKGDASYVLSAGRAPDVCVCVLGGGGTTDTKRWTCQMKDELVRYLSFGAPCRMAARM